ncbi:MAG TPA: hypothetical protein VI006_01615, partial [Solirubrobacteraceae bacterium]
QHHVVGELVRVLRPGGALVIGLHEDLPDSAPELQPWPDARAVYRRATSAERLRSSSRRRPRSSSSSSAHRHDRARRAPGEGARRGRRRPRGGDTE